LNSKRGERRDDEPRRERREAQMLRNKILAGAFVLAMGVGIAAVTSPDIGFGDVPAIDLDDEAIRRLDASDDVDDDGADDDGDGDDTRGDDGTGGGNNTGDGDNTGGNDGTGGGNNTGGGGGGGTNTGGGGTGGSDT
jgi:hypothetical protein